MIPFSSTTEQRYDKRNGSKKFLRRNMNEKASIQTASNYQSSPMSAT